MIFQHTIDNVLNGTKTQTRRLVKPRQRYADRHELGLPPAVFTVSAASEPSPRIQWYVGQTVAVQPGRNAKGIARIRITGIRQEDVRCISDEDAKAEGFEDWGHFMGTWTWMHDNYELFHSQDLWARGGQMLRGVLSHRPIERYTAWVITFVLVKPPPAGSGELGEVNEHD